MKTYDQIRLRPVRFIMSNSIEQFEIEVNNMFELYYIKSFEWRVCDGTHYGKFILTNKRNLLKTFSHIERKN